MQTNLFDLHCRGRGCLTDMAEGTALRIVLPGQELFVKTAGAAANCSICVNSCKLMYYSVVS